VSSHTSTHDTLLRAQTVHFLLIWQDKSFGNPRNYSTGTAKEKTGRQISDGILMMSKAEKEER
jgi:hypothetical protein